MLYLKKKNPNHILNPNPMKCARDVILIWHSKLIIQCTKDFPFTHTCIHMIRSSDHVIKSCDKASCITPKSYRFRFPNIKITPWSVAVFTVRFTVILISGGSSWVWRWKLIPMLICLSFFQNTIWDSFQCSNILLIN